MKNHWRKLLALLPEKAERKQYEKHFKREHTQWVKSGSPLPVSNLSKQKVLMQFQQQNSIKNFVETGTYFGDTLYAVYPHFEQLYSIELSPVFFKKAQQRFKHLQKVQLLQGDSGKVLKHLVPALNSAAIFWLDGHYSGGLTAMGDKECPVYEELNAIFASPFSHLVFIDDARLFIGKNDYPTIEELRAFVQQHKAGYSFSVENDCIRLLPADTRS